MSMLESLLHAVRGVAQTAAAYQMPAHSRRASNQEEECTPCAAHGYVQDLRNTLGQGFASGVKKR